MSTKKTKKKPVRRIKNKIQIKQYDAVVQNNKKWTATQFRIVFSNISFLGTLILAGVAIAFKVTDATIWAFLGMAVSAALGSRLSTS